MSPKLAFVLFLHVTVQIGASSKTCADSEEAIDEDIASLLQTKLGPAIELSQHSSNDLNEDKQTDALKEAIHNDAGMSTQHAASSKLTTSDLQEGQERRIIKEMVHADAGLGSQLVNQNRTDIALVHIPYNFGNTVEKVAMFPKNASVVDYVVYLGNQGSGSFAIPDKPATWESVEKVMRPGGKAFGHLNPDLQVISDVSGCPLYLTPQKYWPKEVAEKYFGKAKRFGIVRDPYEKLVAQVRGGMPDYGGPSKKDLEECAINRAIKERMKELIASNNTFHGGCANVPQHEYFDGEYGIEIAVDNWRFPDSMNEVLVATGNNDWLIETKDILHVVECQQHWSQELDEETKGLVKKVYAKDFDLICEKFGHCNFDEVTCLQSVPTMCPPNLFEWNDSSKIACPKPGADLTNVRMRAKCQ